MKNYIQKLEGFERRLLEMDLFVLKHNNAKSHLPMLTSRDYDEVAIYSEAIDDVIRLLL